jgi:hypothetical protein
MVGGGEFLKNLFSINFDVVLGSLITDPINNLRWPPWLIKQPVFQHYLRFLVNDVTYILKLKLD